MTAMRSPLPAGPAAGRPRPSPPPQAAEPFPPRILRIAFYTFAFSIPFETFETGFESKYSLAKLCGYAMVGIAVLFPTISFRRIPKSLPWFALYLLVWVVEIPYQPHLLYPEIRGRLLSVLQMYALLWISYNLLRNVRVLRGFLLVLAASTALLVILQFVGVTATVEMVHGEERVSALAEGLNALGAELAIGLLAAIALIYRNVAPSTTDPFARKAVWGMIPIIGLGLVRTGSRGSVIALGVGLTVLLLQKGTQWVKLRNFLLIATALFGLVWLNLALNSKRWAETLEQGRLSGRERIYPAAIQMVRERPIFGWGPMNNLYVLGSRLGMLKRDTHNLPLMVLTEVGVVGALPYFIALVVATVSAWRARRSAVGVAALSMLAAVFVVNMAITWHTRKLHWLVLALALASSTLAAQRSRPARRRASLLPRAGTSRRPRPSSLRPERALPGR